MTEHVKIQQSVSKLYKQLTVLEEDRERIYSIYSRRLALLEPLKRDLNPQAYGHLLQEFNVELVEIYAELYDLRRDDIDKGKVKRTKAKIVELNNLARKTIECSKAVTKVIYAIEEDSKFDYLQAVLNMELQCASKYAKLVETDNEIAIKNLQESIKSYTAARKFINDYKKAKKIAQDADMAEDLRTQANICDEMIQLLPEKINRMVQAK